MTINAAVGRLSSTVLLILILLFTAGLSAHAAGTVNSSVDRVNLYVSDLDRAMSFYGSVLGLQAGAVTRHESGSYVHDAMGIDPATPLRETLLHSGEDDPVIGLVEARDTQPPDAVGTTISIEVRSLEASVDAAELLGMTVLDEHERVDSSGQPVRQQVVIDWDGNRIALYSVGPAQARVVDDCIVVGDLVNWKVFDDRQIYIEGNEPGARLLLTTRARCRGALYSRLFEIPNAERRLCRSGSRIAYLDAGLRRTCRVEKIELVPDLEEAASRAIERRQAAQYQ